jgi:hypothetical protein
MNFYCFSNLFRKINKTFIVATIQQMLVKAQSRINNSKNQKKEKRWHRSRQKLSKKGKVALKVLQLLKPPPLSQKQV